MTEKEIQSIEYSIWDPAGNITALVESPVGILKQPDIATAIMHRHPEVEQVGFVSYEEGSANGACVQGNLRMAGGEFCGNASMCAAALYLLRRKEKGQAVFSAVNPASGRLPVKLHVSGASHPVEVFLSDAAADGSFQAGIDMPPACEITEREFVYGSCKGLLAVVRMEGITHIPVTDASAFFALKNEPEIAEQAIRKWCRELSADGLGLLFLDGEGQKAENRTDDEEISMKMTPLVYIPGSNTVFWENSCASGSAAVGVYQAFLRKQDVRLALKEPGGTIRVETNFDKKETRLYSRTRMVFQTERAEA